MTITMKPLSAAELGRLHKLDLPEKIMAFGLMVDKRVVATIGICWKFGGCFLWLDIIDAADVAAERLGLAIVRAARRVLCLASEMGETIVFCQIGEELKDERLLTLSGFEDHGDTLTPDGGEPMRLRSWHSLRA